MPRKRKQDGYRAKDGSKHGLRGLLLIGYAVTEMSKEKTGESDEFYGPDLVTVCFNDRS